MNETNSKRKIKGLRGILWGNLVPHIILTLINVTLLIPIVIGSNIEVFSDYYQYRKTMGPLKEKKEITVQYLGEQKFRSLAKRDTFEYKVPEYKLLGVKKGDMVAIKGIREYDTLTEEEQKMLDNTDIINPGTRIWTATILGLVIEMLLLLAFLGFTDEGYRILNVDSYKSTEEWREAEDKAVMIKNVICFSPVFLFLGLDIINFITYIII